MFYFLYAFSLFLGYAVGAGTETRGISVRISEAEASTRAQATDCHNVMVKAAQGEKLFRASDVFSCLKNVPFSAANANRFIDFYNQTLQYQSTLAFLADPPAEYQQPAVNVDEVLSGIRANVDAGKYTSQYAFEAEIHHLVNRMHDNHVVLEAGIFGVFTFTSPYTLVSASVDGKQTPDIYLYKDIISSQNEGWTPSPISKINNEDAVGYLSEFAALNSDGYVEPNADWNSLMESPARDIQNELSLFQRANFYPGQDLDFTFANGSTVRSEWWALYTKESEFGPLSTPGDFYNYFVLGLVPHGFDPDNATEWWSQKDALNDTTTIEQDGDGEELDDEELENDFGCFADNSSASNWCLESSGAYPNNPIVSQSDIGKTDTGVVTGYLLEDISTAVLSIPSFFMMDEEVADFDAAVEYFIGNATARNTKRLVIDLQQNSGGMSLLAFTLFKRLFNGLDPYTGSRIRSHEAANILGTAYSQWWESLEAHENAANNSDYQNLADSEWVVQNRINLETGKRFSSWKEYYGPIKDHKDSFSQQQLYNLSDPMFDAAMFEWLPIDYTKSNQSLPDYVWDPNDIVLLTDGTCSSACALFVELMTRHAGVRTVAAGGRKEEGPMQTASGNRGARLYTNDDLVADYDFLQQTIGDNSALSGLPNRNDTGIYLDYLSFNVRDQMRKDDKIPLQFKYDAAQCRIYYTLHNVYNMTRLWRDVVAATWENPSLCVQKSTGYAAGPNTTTQMVKPPPAAVAQVPNLNLENVKDSGFVIKPNGGLIDPGAPIITQDKTSKPPPIKQCKSDSECDTELERCHHYRYSCGSGQSLQKHRTRICYTLCRGKTGGCSTSELDESKKLMGKTDQQTLEMGFSTPDSVSRKNFATEKCKIHLLNPVTPKNPAAISQTGVKPASQKKQKSKKIPVQARQLVTKFKS